MNAHRSLESSVRPKRLERLVRPVLGLGTLVALASLTLVAGRAAASGISIHGEIHIGDGPRGPVSQVVPVPHGGVRVDLWSDPDAGAYVRPGDRVRFYFRSNSDTYVTLISVDTEGRARLLFPFPGEDGWVAGGRTYRLPAHRADHDFRFHGPSGVEYVFAVASLAPIRPLYPAWLVRNEWRDLDDWHWDHQPTLYECGWVVGDPLYRMHEFVQRLVPYNGHPGSYDSAWISFNVSDRWRHHGDWRCRHHGPCDCGGVKIFIGGTVVFGGHFDFHVHTPPRYVYWTPKTWKPHAHYKGWYEPRGRWKGRSGRGHESKPKPGDHVFGMPGPRGHDERDDRSRWGHGKDRDDDRRDRVDDDDRGRDRDDRGRGWGDRYRDLDSDRDDDRRDDQGRGRDLRDRDQDRAQDLDRDRETRDRGERATEVRQRERSADRAAQSRRVESEKPSGRSRPSGSRENEPSGRSRSRSR